MPGPLGNASADHGGGTGHSPVAQCAAAESSAVWQTGDRHPEVRAAAVITPRITHLALHVAHLDACVAFYRDFCGMAVVHERRAGNQRIVWMAEPGRETDFVFVLMEGGDDLQLAERDYRHFGFALASRAAVDAVAARGAAAGCLVWPPRDEPFPVGYYCGLRDPNGNRVEFSYGQPLGPGAATFARPAP